MTSTGVGTPTETFAGAWSSGTHRVYVLRYLDATRFCAHLPRRWSRLVMRLGVVGGLPVGLNAVLLAIAPGLAAHGMKATFWLVAFGAVNVIMLIAAITAWAFVANYSSHIDEMLPNAVDRRALAAEVSKRYDWRVQAPAPLVLAAVSMIFLWLVSESMQTVVDVGLASYVSLVISMAIGANDVYWLCNGPPLMTFLLKRPDLAVRWQDPASTPGMRLMADICGLGAGFLLIGAASVSILGFILPQVTTVPVLLWTLVVFFIVDLSVIVWLAVVPLIYIYRTSAAAIAKSLTEINELLPDRATFISNPADRHSALLETYHGISSAPRLPFTTGAVVQYGAALLSTIIAFVLSLT